MKIGLLNPWKHAAENQLIPALARAAATLGHTVVECANTRDILEHRPDFVLSMSRTQPKLTDIPTYGLIFDPRDILLEESIYVCGLLSFDGVFTIFDTLHDFLSDLMFAAGRDAALGYFYPSAPSVAWGEPIAFEAARLAYFGINWDRRRHGLFALLDHQPWMEIYGPECGWSHLTGASYQGMVPFDGTSVLERYHQAGAGLCLFSDSHFSDNIVTSRVFEICAAEAVVIAPRMPWLEQQFGDAVLYIDQDSDDQALAADIAGHIEWIRRQPEAARALAARSHRIFRERFSLDVLLPNVLALHERVQAANTPRTEDPPSARLSVVLPCFDRPAAALQHSLDSLLRQGPCSVDVQVVLGQDDAPAPFDPVVQAYAQHFDRLTVVQPPVPWQSTAVLAALERCTGEYVAVLPGGDAWLPGHLASMLHVVGSALGSRLALAGTIAEHEQEFSTRGGNLEHRRLLPFPFAAAHDDPVTEALQTPIGSLLFHRSLLDGRALADPRLGSTYEAHLILTLLEQEAPVCTARATHLHAAPSPALARHPNRGAAQDIIRLRARFVGRKFPPASRNVDLETLQSLVERGETRRQLDNGLLVRRDGVAEYRIPAAVERLIGPETTWEPVPTSLSLDALTLAEQSRPVLPNAVLPLLVAPPAAPWSDGLVWHPAFPEERPYVVRITCRVESGVAGFGVLSGPHHQLAYRVFVSNPGTPAVVDLPIQHPGGIEGIVIQSTLSTLPVRVVVQRVELFAARARFPLVAVERFMEENAELRVTLNTVEHRREVLVRAFGRQETTMHALTAENTRLRTALRAAEQEHAADVAKLVAQQQRQASRVQRLGNLYRRVVSRLRKPLRR
jgi:hypothetical protein